MAKGTQGPDLLSGTDANDTLRGRGGDDTVVGGPGEDVLEGNAGRDTVDFRGETQGGLINLSTRIAVFGQEIDVIASFENVYGTEFADEIIPSFKRNAIWGEGGDDTIHGGRGDDTLSGGSGDDQLHGGQDEDVLKGGADDDFLNGDEGDDRLAGGAGDDVVYGGAGNDKLTGADGDDALNGEKGADTLSGGRGMNGLDGGGGDDTFYFSKGASDYVTTGSGADTLVLQKGGRGVQVGDFNVRADLVALDVADPSGITLEGLRQSGELTVTGDASFTLITFGSSEMVLQGVDASTFNDDALSIV